MANAPRESIILAPPFFAMIVAEQAAVPYAVLIFIAALMVGGIVGGSLWGRLATGNGPWAYEHCQSQSCGKTSAGFPRSLAPARATSA